MARRPRVRKMAQWLASHNLDLAEYWTGELTQAALIVRAKRRGDDDLHEIRHLYAFFDASDSSSCKKDTCRLLGVTIIDQDDDMVCRVVVARDEEYELGQPVRRAAPEGWRGLLTNRSFVLRVKNAEDLGDAD